MNDLTSFETSPYERHFRDPHAVAADSGAKLALRSGGLELIKALRGAAVEAR